MPQLLSDEEIGKALGHLRDWRLEEGALVREAELESFPQAIQVVNRIAEIAENDNHHPDIDIRWRKVTLGLTTHDAGGLTFRDTRGATEADRLFAEVCKAG